MQNLERMERSKEAMVNGKVTKQLKKEKISARNKIKSRGLIGLYKDKIFYDENIDIFNLGL